MKMEKTRESSKQGISLIVLVITIIVMIILATTVVITLNNSGIISKANDAVDATDLANVQDLATMLWAEKYLELKENATVKNLKDYIVEGLGKAKIDTTKYNLDVTLSGVTVEIKSEIDWVEIVTTPITIESDTTVISDSNIFIDGYVYRVSIQGPSYNGQLICKALFMGEDGLELFGLIDIGSAEQPTWETLGDVDFENTRTIQVGYAPETGCVMVFGEEMEGHTITKIEGIKPKLVYKLEENQSAPEILEIAELSIDKSYIIECEKNGVKMYLQPYIIGNMSITTNDPKIPTVAYADTFSGGSGGACILRNGTLVPLSGHITAIYEIGTNPAGVAFENGFCAVEVNINKLAKVTRAGELISSPEGSCVIPERVGDVEIQFVEIDSLICSTATFVHNVTVANVESAITTQKVIIKKSAYELLEQPAEFKSKEIDITDFGDEVVIPEEWLNDSMSRIYVTKWAKENNYLSNINVYGVE